MVQKEMLPGGNDRKVRERCYTVDFENEGRGHKSQFTKHAASRSCGDKQQPHPHTHQSLWKENGPYHLTCSHTLILSGLGGSRQPCSGSTLRRAHGVLAEYQSHIKWDKQK